MSPHSSRSPTQAARDSSPTAAERRRSQAVAIKRLAVGKIDWCENPVVIKRYENDPTGLASIAASAREALQGAETLTRDAEILEAREQQKGAT